MARNARENFEQSAGHVGVTVSKSTSRAIEGTHGNGARGIARDHHRSCVSRRSPRHARRPAPRSRLLVSGEAPAGRLGRGRLHRIQRTVSPCRPDRGGCLSGHGAGGRGPRRPGATHLSRLTCALPAISEGRALLPFYRAYRAAVRGKVEGMKLAEAEVPESEKARRERRPRRAGSLPWPSWNRRAANLAWCSWAACLEAASRRLARELGEAAGFSVVRSDVVRKELAGRARVSERLKWGLAKICIQTNGTIGRIESACAEPRKSCSKAVAC